MIGNIATDYGSFNIASSTSQGGVPETPRFTINKDGNVGIGNTAPSQILHVSGNIRVTGAYYDSGNSAGTSGQILSSTATGTSWIAAPSGSITGSGTTNYVPKWTSGSAIGDSAIYDNAGNIGIGTTSPSYKFHVQGSGVLATFRNSSTGVDQYTQLEFIAGSRDAYIWLGNQNTTSWAGDGGLNIYTGTGNMDFWTAATQKMRLTASGNLGIGTTSPTATLQINGAGGDSTPTLRLISAASDTFNWASDSRYANLTAGETSIHLIGKANSQYNQAYFGYRHVSDGSSSNMASIGLYAADYLLNVLGSGNVGINTTAPNAKLNVCGTNGSASVNAQEDLLHIGANELGGIGAYAGIRLAGTSGADYGVYIRGVKTTAYGNYWNDALTFSVTRTNTQTTIDEVMRITSGGNVGIGTTGPSTKLHISGTTTNITITDTTYGRTSNIGYIDSANLYFANDSASNTYIGRYNSVYLAYGGGSVGINTTNPAYKLDVIGNVRSYGGLYSNGYHADTFIQNLLPAANNGSGSGDVQLRMWCSEPGITWDWAGFGYNVLNDGAGPYGFGRWNGSFGQAYMRFSTDGSMFFYNTTTANVRSTTMTLSAGGNVGIGASPSYKLDVAGDARITSGSLGVGVAPNATDGRIDASNDIVAFSSSDLRLKENIKPIENALDKVKSLTGVEFDWKPELKHAHGYEGHDTGVIAQEVQEVMPTAIRTNDTGYLAVRYEKLIGLLIEANKELATRVEQLESKLK
jgi:hypothetical protein